MDAPLLAALALSALFAARFTRAGKPGAPRVVTLVLSALVFVVAYVLGLATLGRQLPHLRAATAVAPPEAAAPDALKRAPAPVGGPLKGAGVGSGGKGALAPVKSAAAPPAIARADDDDEEADRQGSAVAAAPVAPRKLEDTYIVYVPDRSGLYSGNLPAEAAHTSYAGAMADHNLGNVGNFVWQYGAYVGLPDFSSTRTCNVSRGACDKKLREEGGKGVVEYRPVSNFFNKQRGNDFGYDNGLIDRNGIMPLFVGIGVQDYFNPDADNDIVSGPEIVTRAQDFEFRPGERGVLTKLQKHKFPMLVRGDYTRDATRAFGYEYAVSNGCPSLMISRDVHLGQTLQRKYEALRGRIGDRSLRVAINIKNKPGFTRLYLGLLKRYPNSFVYAQGMGDFRALRDAGVGFERMRIFNTVAKWRESVATMDVSFGGRIHGNMVSLSVGVPVVVIAPDHRVLELVRRMKVPHTHVYAGAVDVDAEVDVARVASSAGFDGDAFDRNRCEIAKTYVDVLGRFGIGVQAHVRAIAGLC